MLQCDMAKCFCSKSKLQLKGFTFNTSTYFPFFECECCHRVHIAGSTYKTMGSFRRSIVHWKIKFPTNLRGWVKWFP